MRKSLHSIFYSSILCALMLVAGCEENKSGNRIEGCDFIELQDVFETPADYNDKAFCGEIVFNRLNNRLVIEYDGLDRVDTTLYLVPSVPEELYWIYSIDEENSRWIVIGSIKLMTECFDIDVVDHREGNGCVPHFFPAEMIIEDIESVSSFH